MLAFAEEDRVWLFNLRLAMPFCSSLAQDRHPEGNSSCSSLKYCLSSSISAEWKNSPILLDLEVKLYLQQGRILMLLSLFSTKTDVNGKLQNFPLLVVIMT